MILATRMLGALGGGGNVTVDVGVESIEYTTYGLTIPGVNQTIPVGVESIVYTEYAPTIIGNTAVISPATESIIYTGQNLTINDGVPQNVSVGTESILYTEYAPTIIANVDISVGVETIRYTEYAPTVSIPNQDLTISYLSNSTSSSTASSYTFSSMSIGAAPSTGQRRFIIVGVSGWSEDEFSGVVDCSAVTVGGLSATRLVDTNSANTDTYTGFFIREVTSGTTASVVLTTSNTDAVGVALWRVIAYNNQNLASTLYKDTDVALASFGGTTDMLMRPDGTGDVLVAMTTHGFVTPGSTTWTVSGSSYGTENFDDLVSGNWAAITATPTTSSAFFLDMTSSSGSGKFTAAGVILHKE